MNIPESNVITRDIICSVATMNKQGQHNNNRNDLDELPMNDLRARLELQGKDIDGPKETLIARLRKAV
jgi:hypothetical protein